MVDLITILASGAEGHAEPSALFMDATGWVSISMLILIGIVLWKKVPGVIGAKMDSKIAEIKAELDEAKALRTEAEKLRAEYESKLATAETEAEELRARAELEATHIIEQARQDATDLIARRKQMAEEKISAAERHALQDIRQSVSRAASEAARTLIEQHHDQTADRAQISQNIRDLGKYIN